jgi:hypothetical protein
MASAKTNLLSKIFWLENMDITIFADIIHSNYNIDPCSRHVVHRTWLQNRVWNEGHLPCRGRGPSHPEEPGAPAEVAGRHSEGQLEAHQAFSHLLTGTFQFFYI